MSFRMITSLLLLFAVTSCGTVDTLKKMNTANEFEEATKTYNWMIRWHELETAAASFASDSLKEEFSERVRAAKGVTITNYQIRSREFYPEKNLGMVVVEIEYFIPPSVTVKTLEDVQTWEYQEKNGKKSWRLTSLLPEFK